MNLQKRVFIPGILGSAVHFCLLPNKQLRYVMHLIAVHCRFLDLLQEMLPTQMLGLHLQSRLKNVALR